VSSDRSFGYLFVVVFGAFGGYAAWTGKAWGWGAIAVAVVMAILATLAPTTLHGLNRAWHALGLALGRIVNPIVLGILFFGVVTPIGLLMRACGKRPLSLRFEPDAKSYWVERTPRGPAPESMRDQF
jgi:hypothetical protein